MKAKSHQFEVCRALYAQVREQGCPAVVVVELAPDFMVVETADGKVKNEGVNACCKWAAKYNCGRSWLEQNQQ
jgi:hypothetical protein